MRVGDLSSKRVAIWGLGVEGQAALRLIRGKHPNLALALLDEKLDADCPDEPMVECFHGGPAIERALDSIDVVVKSPGVSLYHPLLNAARGKRIEVTSLLNLWFAEPREPTTICVTGSKGKSTTASLIAHALASLGKRVDLVGNIGVPITEARAQGQGYIVLEVSSYQAADFDGTCDIGVLTSLHEDHLDWHGSPHQYYKDKTNLLLHSKIGIVSGKTVGELTRLWGAHVTEGFRQFGTPGDFHFIDGDICKGPRRIAEVRNPYLRRAQNMWNLCGALTVVDELGLDFEAALAGVEGFRGLPHRQQELGEIDGRTFVDDSISTTSVSAMAALAAYAGRYRTIILGGYDRGIDYSELVEAILGGAAQSVICLGASGARIYDALRDGLRLKTNGACDLHRASTMDDAVAYAKRVTPRGGVVILSPAAKSDGHYKNFIERGRDFAEKVGLPNPFYENAWNGKQ
jgi:UDP-N-acetylmuramoylalanine--D-glutamate ligase